MSPREQEWYDAMVANGHVPRLYADGDLYIVDGDNHGGPQCSACDDWWCWHGCNSIASIDECSEREKAEADFIKNRDLPKLSGIPAHRIRDWRRRGFVPKDAFIPPWWIDVVKDVAKTETNLKKLFDRAIKWEKPAVGPREGRGPKKAA